MQFLKKADIFGTQLPAFNLKGQSQVRTIFGGTFSVIIIYITFMFAMLKFVHLMTKHGPQVNSFELADAYSTDDVFRPADENF